MEHRGSSEDLVEERRRSSTNGDGIRPSAMKGSRISPNNRRVRISTDSPVGSPSPQLRSDRPVFHLGDPRRSLSEVSETSSSDGTMQEASVFRDNDHSYCSLKDENRSSLLLGMTMETRMAARSAMHEALRQRRTSLPASSFSNSKPAVVSSNISEARGIIADMLMKKDLPSNVASCLRAVSTLLHPPNSNSWTSHDLGLPEVIENPMNGETLLVNSSSKPRVSNITFSTVTSATGLPTIAAEPSRPRSSSYWKPETSSSSHQLNREDSSVKSRVNGPSQNCCRRNESDAVASTSHEERRKRGDDSPCRPTFVVSNNKTETSDEETFSDSGVSTVVTRDGCEFRLSELNSDSHLKRIADWALPIFDMAHRHPQTVLSRICYGVFKQADLFRIFKLSYQKFFNYCHALERGYWDIPYHNRIHAADVLHGCYYLTCHPVRPFMEERSASPEGDHPSSSVPSSHFSPLAECMSNLELMALYTAAAMHDYDHPGKTNAFLVATEDKKAILYNDRSVLENHHAAESWRLLQQSGNNFIDTLDAAETKRFRYLVLEYILATDLKQHFEIIVTFNEKANEMDLSNESDRLMISKMLIKLADINSPSKPYPLHRTWTDRICAEFYDQGDEEKRRNMPVTPYMDRQDPAVSKLQDSFIAHLVSPLAMALNEAGLLPILPGLEEPEIMINLKHNHQKWLLELDTASSSSGVGTATETIDEMEESASESPDAQRRDIRDGEERTRTRSISPDSSTGL